MNNLSSVGLFLRNKRNKTGESLRAMGGRIGISGAYLSAIELGQRDINNKIIEKLVAEYDLDVVERKKIIFLTETSRKNVRIKNGDSDIKRELLVEFKRKYRVINDEKAAELLLIIHSI